MDSENVHFSFFFNLFHVSAVSQGCHVLDRLGLPGSDESDLSTAHGDETARGSTMVLVRALLSFIGLQADG